MVSNSLTCIKFSGFCPDLHYPFRISSFRMIAFKITVDDIFVVLSRPFFPLSSLRCIVALVFDCVPEIRTANIRRNPFDPHVGYLCSSSWLWHLGLSSESLVDQDLDLSFFMGCICGGLLSICGLVLLQEKEHLSGPKKTLRF